MSLHQKRIEAARQLVARLKAEGRTTDARVVNDLARSSAVSAGLNRQLHTNLADALERVRKADLEVEAHRREIARRPGL